MKYRLHPEAACEHRQQVAYYEERQTGLGRRYHAAFRAALALACKAPLRARVIHPPDLRRIGLAGFPFDLIYRQANGAIEILALAHHRRKPGYWASRYPSPNALFGQPHGNPDR